MIEKKDLIQVGKFQKTHALQGELNAILEVEPDFAENEHPFIVEIDGIYVPFYIESIRPKGSTSYLVKLRGIDSQEKAQEMVNKEVYALRSDAIDYFPIGDDEVMDDSDILGFEVVDSQLGRLGTVKEINDTTENVLLVVEADSGEEIYVPLVDEFIDDINPEQHIVEVSLPEGLVTLNQKKDKDE